MSNTTMARNQREDKKITVVFVKKFLRKLSIYLISLGIVIATTVGTFYAVLNNLTTPVDPKDTTDIKIEIRQGSTVSQIADVLYDNKLIRNKGIFKLFIDFSGKERKLQAGRYKLSKNMSLEEIMASLLTGGSRIPNKKITIQEGLTIHQVASKLVTVYELPFTQEEFLNAAKVENFPDYGFLQDIPENRRNSSVPLEGYLFPDTYIVPEDASPELIIKVMLNQFEKTFFKEEYTEKAKEYDLTPDQIVILASIIQKEAKVKEEFNKVSAVFHNRLKIGKKLEADSTVVYALNTDRGNTVILTDEETKVDSPYNTYKYDGLPEGPISCPGEWALNAALSPYKPYMDTKKPYLYYVLMDPATGEHKFNYSYDAHVRDKNEYKKLWK